MKKVLSRLEYNSPVTLTFAIISLVALILGNLTGGKSTTLLFCVYPSGFDAPFTYFRLFGHVFGHSNLEHYLNNMMMIFLMGPIVEEKYGGRLLVFMMAVTAFITGIINLLKKNTNLKGASNIVFMLIVLSAFVNISGDKIPLTLVLIILFYIIDEIKDIKKNDGVAHYGHLIGALCGLAFGFIYLNNDIWKIIIETIENIL